MAKFVVHYEMRNGMQNTRQAKTVECENERIAIEIVKGQAQSMRPDYEFIVTKIEKK